MMITERRVDDLTILDIDGRITVQDGADQFRAAIQRVLDCGQSNVVMNFLKVPYIDSTALGEIVRAFTTAKQMGGAVKLLHAGGRVRDLLAMTGLAPVIESFATEAEVIRSFSVAQM